MRYLAPEYISWHFCFPLWNRRPRELPEGMASRVNDPPSASSSEVLHIEFLHTVDSCMMEVWFCLMQCHWVGFVGPLEGLVLVLWSRWGGFFWDMVSLSYVGSFVTWCIGFQILCALLMLWVIIVASLVFLIAHTAGLACCTFMKRVVEKFCPRGKPERLLSPDYVCTLHFTDMDVICYSTTFWSDATLRWVRMLWPVFKRFIL